RALAADGPDEDVVAVDDDPDRHVMDRALRRARLDLDRPRRVEELAGEWIEGHQAASGSGGPAIARACRSGGRKARAISTTFSRVTARSSDRKSTRLNSSHVS